MLNMANSQASPHINDIFDTNYTIESYRQLEAICKAVEFNYELF